MFLRDIHTLSSIFLLTVCALCFLLKEAVAVESLPIFASQGDHRKQNLRRGTNRNNGEGNRIESDNQHRTIHDNGNKERSLIIGGVDATDYPRSIAFLSDRVDDLSCGGSLISPRIVLAAGHCEISLVTHAVFHRYNHPAERLASTGLGINSDQELRVPIQQEILHPEYDGMTLENDVMLLVLEYSPNNTTDFDTVPYMKLHTSSDPTLDELVTMMARQTKENTEAALAPNEPSSTLLQSSWPFSTSASSSNSPKTTNLQFKALGWGHTVDGELGEPSETLQEVTINYVQNKECETARENDFLTYKDRITDDMMCTFASNRDTCHGDSGGPIVLPNPSPSENEVPFVQVGIVSWGEDCADHVFPGVASRVASSYEWIRDRVCSIDGSRAPATFGCDLDHSNEHTFSPAPSQSPTTEEDGLEKKLRSEGLSMVDNETFGAPKTHVRVAVEIFLDVFATETSWRITETNTGIPVIVVPFDTYRYENRIREEVELNVGEMYTFKIEDQYGDGITNLGSYRVYVIDESQPDHIGEMLINEMGDFKVRRTHSFQIRAANEPFAMDANLTNTTENTLVGRVKDDVP